MEEGHAHSTSFLLSLMDIRQPFLIPSSSFFAPPFLACSVSLLSRGRSLIGLFHQARFDRKATSPISSLRVELLKSRSVTVRKWPSIFRLSSLKDP
eukprot:6173803-Pleurochrysis_carterae.AAC.1